MDVSNSSGGSTGYRVLGSGGAAPWPPPREGIVLAENNLPEGGCLVEELSVEEEWVQAESGQEKGGSGAQMQPVLKEGILKANTYATVPVPGSGVCVVEFLRDLQDKKPFRRYKVTGRYEELLVALVPNGDDTPKALVCSKVKV